MARPIPQWQRPIVAKWLLDTRLRQRRTVDGEPWSQDDLLNDLEQLTGKRLHRPNYSGYEQRGSMEPGTLRLFQDYWAKKKEPGPNLTQPAKVEPELPSIELALMALARELTAARQERESLRGEVAQLRATVARLVEASLGPGGKTGRAARPAPGA